MILYGLYWVLIWLFTPFLWVWIHMRRRHGKEDAARYKERFGIPSKTRPKGKIYWFHGASNGECLSFLPVMRALKAADPEVRCVFTSGTRTAAQLLEKHMARGDVHQFAPLDHPLFVKRFLDHFQPVAAFRTESDHWPITLLSMEKRGPLFLLNGRLSEKSYRIWAYFRPFYNRMMRAFRIIFPQSFADYKRYKEFGLTHLKMIGNLKFEGVQLAVDANTVHQLKKDIGRRPVWVASNTHTGEEETVIQAHVTLTKRVHAKLLLILVPRHKDRLPVIHKMLDQAGLRYIHRTDKKKITEDVHVFIVDTMGELGTIYSLAPFVFMAGSLFRHIGGHNVLEPARLGVVPVFGPHMENNQEMATLLLKNKAAIQFKKPQHLPRVVGDLLADFKGTKRRAETVKSILSNINIVAPTVKEIQRHLA